MIALLPSVEEVLKLPAARRVVAPPEWEDGNGHVNVTHFYRFHMEAAEAELIRVGVEDTYREDRGLSVFSMEQHLRYLAEVRIGEEISAHVRWLDRGDKVFHGISVVVNHTTGALANTVEFVEGHVDLRTRRLAPFPSDLAERIDAELERHRSLPWSLPLAGPMGVRR
ncbi:thioesterase family protein [Dietzia kunjamensis]|uniref:thioesterase family protein n=1 Tax=Dietzia kunjamensis TaxID=322509 RepID=UPI0020971C81|nr:thioesterase family protein [Dietzia kunjamensis]USX45837.1 thioesterase family protein [Dietzia kunjamensis]